MANAGSINHMEVEAGSLVQEARDGAASWSLPQPALADKFIQISGHQNVLARLPILTESAARHQQAGVMDQFAFYLSACKIRAKMPHLFLLLGADGHPYAAVLNARPFNAVRDSPWHTLSAL